MTERIINNLTRQKRALQLLEKLQEEEFSLLMDLNPRAVTALEFSIQELLRQFVREREELRAIVRSLNPAGGGIAGILEAMDPVSRKTVNFLLVDIDKLEQTRSIQAEKNSRMAMALFEQSKSYVSFIQDKVAPKSQTYDRRGEMGAYARRSRVHGHTLGRT